MSDQELKAAQDDFKARKAKAMAGREITVTSGKIVHPVGIAFMNWIDSRYNSKEIEPPKDLACKLMFKALDKSCGIV